MLVVLSSLQKKMVSPSAVPKGISWSTLRALQHTAKRHMKEANSGRRPAISRTLRFFMSQEGQPRPLH